MTIMELFEQENYIYTNGEQTLQELSDVLLRDDLPIYLQSCYADQGITSLETRLTADIRGSRYENNGQSLASDIN